MKLELKLVVCLLSIFVLVSPSKAMDPREILRKADESRGNLEGVEWIVRINSVERERKQYRSLDVKARGYDFLAVMTDPPKVRGQRLLMIDHNMWYMKPGLRKPVPVSPRQRLVGGASYGDIAATNYADDYSIISVTDAQFNGQPCYLFDLRAADRKATYDHIKYWISKARIVGIKAEYYTVSDKLLKTATFEYAHKVRVDDEVRPFISRMVIKDALLPENITTMVFSDPELKSIPNSVFDLNFLIMR